MQQFDVIVIGGGHAGIEASVASAKMGCKTALFSMDTKTIGRLSCNPSIGGSAKGHLAKEIDALGGVMGMLADKSGLQFKLLNTSKGPAVWSSRTQNDKDLYPMYAQQLLQSTQNLTIVNKSIVNILISNEKIVGIETEDKEIVQSRCVVLCSG
ncbi:MAG: FAD-dependent oxidoreductase, partial [Ignavibacteria bacterium]|nr:FAD-dependent oxidoreductase [Ignavibacteria bacterium]